MELKSLAGTDFGTLYDAFADAFADYEVRIDGPQFRRMLRRRGFVPELSFAAFDGERIIAFTLNGIGNHEGVPTAYDTGTGTLTAYRGQGLATRIFEHSIPYLKEAGIRRYLLEVLQHNTKAVFVYRKLGFETSREFNYFSQETAAVECRTAPPGFPHAVRRIDIRQYGEIPGFRDFPPSWQNSFESIGRAAGDLVGFGLFAGEELVGYCVFEPDSGDIAQLAVERRFRGRGVGSLLLQEAAGRNRSGIVKIINTDTACDAVTRFLENRNIPVRGRQFEMIRPL